MRSLNSARTLSIRKSNVRFTVAIAFVVAIFSVVHFARAADLPKEATTALGPEVPDGPNTLVMVVMDPLALPLSCPCVLGYAQRDYDKLAAKLQKDLERPVRVVYSESLTKALKENAKGKAHIVVGKRSVVQYDANKANLKVTSVAKLSGKDGLTHQTGLIVVPSDDPAKTAADLKGYRIVFGPEECDEKHSAALALLKDHGVAAPEKLETSAACSDGACAVLDAFKKDAKSCGAAVISSYAKPLLEGCGTVQKGDLRVIAETKPVPFVEAFVSNQIPESDRAKVATAIVKSTTDPLLRIALETRDGFLASAAAPAATTEATSAEVAKKK
jgi:ABC-type phosphate/phosphonate transport system substrate-binding protein